MSAEGPYARHPSPSDALGAAKDGNVLPVPIHFGKYYLLEKVATGGMAEVFKAKAFGVEGFERLLAVKKILPSISEDTEFISMFIDEAKIAGRLNHANIAQIFDLGKYDGSYFIALEYVSGHNTRQIFERCRRDRIKLGIDMACYVVMKACEGLDYAHNKTDSLGNPLNIVHRDVSPQNILVSYEGEVKIIDFGIAKAAGKSTQTQVGILKGKFSYMSPEQVRGLSLDRRSDIFSLNIVLYELLTLQRLFLGESDFETLEKIRKVDVAPPTLHNPHIPKELEDLVLKGLSKDPNMRFQTTAEMQEALQKFMFNQPIYFTNKDLSAAMQSKFADELRLERRKLEYYQTLDLDTIRIQTGEIEGPAVMRGTGSDLDWDDDEIATTVYVDTPEDDLDLEGVIDDLGAGDAAWDAGGGDGSIEGSAIVLADDDSDVIELDADEDAWDRLIAAEPLSGEHAVPETPIELPSARPSGLYPVVRRRSTTALLIVLGAAALALGIGVVWFITSLGQGIEMVFAPTPSDVQIVLGDRIIHDGETPFTYGRAEPGNYELTIVADNYEPMTQTVTLAEGGKYNITWTLNPAQAQPAALLVSTTPAGASIWLDDVDTGRLTPDELTELEPGSHTVRLVRDGYLPIERQVDIGDAQVSLDEELVAAQFRLVIRAQPADATFILSDQETGLEVRSGPTPLDLNGLDGSKTYLVIIEAPDHLRYTELLPPSGLRERRVETTLRPVASTQLEEVAAQTSEQSADTVAENPGEAPQGQPDEQHQEAEQERTERDREAERQRDAERERRRREAEEQARQEALEAARRHQQERQREDDDERVAAAEATDTPPEGTDQEAVEPGYLSVQCRPAARVYIDGEEVGFTPIRNHALAPGTYRIRLVNEDFGLDHLRTVTIRSGNQHAVIHRQD